MDLVIVEISRDPTDLCLTPEQRARLQFLKWALEHGSLAYSEFAVRKYNYAEVGKGVS